MNLLAILGGLVVLFVVYKGVIAIIKEREKKDAEH